MASRLPYQDGMATIVPRAVLAALSLALTTGCAAQGAYLNEGPTALGKPPYQVGPVTVVIRPQAEVEMICRLRSSPGAPEGRIHGCYVPADHLIVSTADPYVLMHEFKHYFEGPSHK
jgi:hypothetical protein